MAPRFSFRHALPIVMSLAHLASAESAAPGDPNTDNINALVSGAQGLLSSYYPSTIISDLKTVTWPSTVVINGETMTVPSKSTVESAIGTFEASTTAASSSAAETPSTAASVSSSTTSASSSPTSSASSSSDGSPSSTAASTPTDAPLDTSSKAKTATGMTSEKRLGIIIGVVIGVLAFAVLIFLMIWMHRRKKRTGSYLRHPPQDVEDTEYASNSEVPAMWPDGSSSHTSRIWAEKYAPVSHSGPHMDTMAPPAPMPAAYNRHTAYDSSSGESTTNPFYTPNEEPGDYNYNQVQPNRGLMVDTRQHTTANRPPTPLMHEFMRGNNNRENRHQSPVSPIEPGNNLNNNQSRNPFASPEDSAYDEPPLPARSPDRRHSPQVYYPTQPEIQRFDFDLARHQSQRSAYSRFTNETDGSGDEGFGHDHGRGGYGRG